MRVIERRSFVVAAAAALGACRESGFAREREPGALVGTWRVMSYEDRAAGGATTYPYGERPIGYLAYDASGHMSVQITKAPSPARRGGRARPGEERPEPAYTAYFGTYTVDWDRKIITHTVEGNLYPAFVGTSHERPFELEGDRLILRPKWVANGRSYEGERAFERLR